MIRPSRRLILLLLLGPGSLSLYAQGPAPDPNYVVWVEPDVDSCVAGGSVTARVFLEIKPTAKAGVSGWRFSVCHDLPQLRFSSAAPGAATKGVCDGNEPAVNEIAPLPNALGFTARVTLPPPGAACSLPPGCPYELAVASYACSGDIAALPGLFCFCDVAGELPVVLDLDDGTSIVPTTICGPHQCEVVEPPPSDHTVWVEPDTDTCVAGEPITVRVFLEIKPTALGVTGWRLGVCHDPQLVRFSGAMGGTATQGVCNGQDAAVSRIDLLTRVPGFRHTAVLPLPGETCALPPGCPHELTVATYLCSTDIPRLPGLFCFCEDPLIDVPGPVTLTLEDGSTIVPQTICDRHRCEGQPPPPRPTCDCTATDFWLAFPGNLSIDPAAPKDLALLIASEPGAKVTVEVPALGIVQNLAVAPNSVEQVLLPHEVELGLASDVIDKKGIHVTSDNPIQVHGVNEIQYTVDGFLALPTVLLETEYFALGYRNVHAAPEVINGSQFAIVATQDGTVVNIKPTVETDGHPAGLFYSVHLDRGHTYQLTNLRDGTDLSGTEIQSNLPIGVFGSHRCATIPNGGEFFCNHNVEQLPPTSLWGQQYLAMPLATRVGGDTFRFLAQADGTTISVNGVPLPIPPLARGRFHETVLSVRSHITSNLPVLVAQYARGTWVDDVDRADPSMMLLQPINAYRDRFIVSTPPNWFDNLNFLHVIAPTAAAGTILLDGVAIPAGDFNPIHLSGFSGAQVKITKGMPHLLNGPTLFGVVSYGFDNVDAYSFPGCFSFGRASTVGGQIDCIPDDRTQPPPIDRQPIVQEAFFVRGDTNASGSLDISDGITILLHLFLGQPLDCLKAADTDAGGSVDLTDAVTTFTYLFGRGSSPPPPFPACGPDTTPDHVNLTCDAFPPCAEPGQ